MLVKWFTFNDELYYYNNEKDRDYTKLIDLLILLLNAVVFLPFLLYLF